MTNRSNGLIASALAVSAGVHLLLLLLVPWKPMQPRMAAREVVPVRLVHVSPATRPPAARAELATPREIEVPPHEEVAVVPEEAAPPVQPEQLSEPLPEQVELMVTSEPTPSSVLEEPTSAQTTTAVEVGESVSVSVVAAPIQPSAEIAAYKAILSILRERIISETRYPAIARANGWKGRVILAVRLDAKGKLLQAVVRQSSGYEVLDRAAVTLMRKITRLRTRSPSP